MEVSEHKKLKRKSDMKKKWNEEKKWKEKEMTNNYMYDQ